MLASLICTAHLTCPIPISIVGETNIKRLVNEKHMTKQTPWVREQFASIVDDPDGSVLSESTELWASSGSTLKPDDQWNILIHDIWAHTAKKVVEHVWLSSWSIPVDLLEAYLKHEVPEYPWKCISEAV